MVCLVVRYARGNHNAVGVSRVPLRRDRKVGSARQCCRRLQVAKLASLPCRHRIISCMRLWLSPQQNVIASARWQGVGGAEVPVGARATAGEGRHRAAGHRLLSPQLQAP
eukprot:3826296-Rhodomonas_salina.2